MIELIITTIVGFVINYYLKKRQKEHQELDQLRKTQMYDNFRDTIHQEVVSIKTEINVDMISLQNQVQNEVGRLEADLTLVKKGLQKDLYVDLCNIYHKLKHQKFATIQEKRDYHDLYVVYHNLGKNGVADSMYQEVMGMPDSLPTEGD